MYKRQFLLTTKPVLYVCNVDDVSAASGNQYVEQVREAIKGEDAELIIISAQTEADIAELETYEEKQMFLEDLGLKESGCNRLIKAIYSLLNLETFITAGEMEVKAWTYRKGWKAPQCAGVIHTDFEKGFIRAEVIKYEDYIKYGSETAVREAGKLGVEGKEYVCLLYTSSQLCLIVGQCLCVPVEVTIGRFCKRVVVFAALEAGSTFRVTIRGDRILIVMVILGDITWSGLN